MTMKHCQHLYSNSGNSFETVAKISKLRGYPAYCVGRCPMPLNITMQQEHVLPLQQPQQFASAALAPPAGTSAKHGRQCTPSFSQKYVSMHSPFLS